MIRHLALASILAVGAGVMFAPTAKAQDAAENVRFDGTVPPFCEFDNVRNGTLAVDANPATQLSSYNPGGISGYVDLTCNIGSEVKVESVAVVKLAGPTLNPIKTTAYINDGNEDVFDTPVVDEEIKVDLDVYTEADEILPAGDYDFLVRVTATAS